MKTKITNFLSESCGIFATATGIQDIESFMGIIYVALGIAILLINFGLRIHDRFKDDGKFDKKDKEDTIKDAKDTIDKIDDLLKK